MSKGNLFLGFGRGKVGDVVFSRVGGEQVARARNRSPKNPQTPLQLLQRVVMKTSSQAFSLMQDICNHSFQGAEGVTANQSVFTRLNVSLFRNQLAEEINSGDPEVILTSSQSNFSPKDAMGAVINPYIISAGRLPKVEVNWRPPTEPDDHEAYPELTATQENAVTTYQGLANYLNLQQGDQLTFIALTCDDTEAGASPLFNGFHYGRFIIDPDDGDMSHLLSDNTHWNAKTENIKFFAPSGSDGATFVPNDIWRGFNRGQANSVVAFAVIASRLVGGVWSRSDAQLLIKPWTVGSEWHLRQDHGDALLSDAIYSFMTDPSSLLYLNQAET